MDGDGRRVGAEARVIQHVDLLQQLLARGDLLRRPADVQRREACLGRFVAMMPGTRQSSIMLFVTFVVCDRNVDTSSLPSLGCASI